MSDLEAIASCPSGESSRLGALKRFAGNCAQTRVLGGSVIMLTGSALVSLLNFAYNLAVARMLGPVGFGHAAVAITLLMFVSAVTLSFQLVGAKLVARGESLAEKGGVYQRLMRRAWKLGAAIGIALTVGSGVVARYLNLPSARIILVLAVGFAFYVPVGARRGGMQGMCSFKRLAASYVSEALLKFVGALLLVQAGFGVMGAIIAISASLIFAYFIPTVPRELKSTPAAVSQVSGREARQAIVYFAGQVLICNTDILLIKHFFSPERAGIFAAIALVGRLVYFASWMVVSAMFPIAAGTKEETSSKSLVAIPIVFVIALTGGFVTVLSLFPNFVLHMVFGPMFSGGRGLDSLLVLYALNAGIYSLSVALIVYEMSRKIANTGWWQLAFSGAIVTGIYLYHATLREVISVELMCMTGLLIVVALPFLRRVPPTLHCQPPSRANDGRVGDPGQEAA
jgi:O-antigen/teichoic acid export membrane protein